MRSGTFLLIYIAVFLQIVLISCGNTATSDIKLPPRGLCAHRGAMQTLPENTLIAFREAIKAGAHMIEFDVFLSKDDKMVVIHDETVDRTTNGTGRISDLTFEQIRNLDAGGWKSPEFAGEKIPTLHEVLEIMPFNIWLNVHLKGEGMLSVMVADKLAKEGRLHQAFLACSAGAAHIAREAVPGIMICNMDRRDSDLDYVMETIKMKADFIQFRQPVTPALAQYAKLLKENNILINFFGTDSPEEIRLLFQYGVDFPLVNDIISSIPISSELDIQPVLPEFASGSN